MWLLQNAAFVVSLTSGAVPGFSVGCKVAMRLFICVQGHDKRDTCTCGIEYIYICVYVYVCVCVCVCVCESKVQFIICHAGINGKHRYSSTLSLTSALDRVVVKATPRPFYAR